MTRLPMALLLAVAGCGTPSADPAGLPDPDALLFERLDRDGSGRVTADEIHDVHAVEIIAAWDTDGSGDLDADEVGAALSSPPPDRRGSTGKSKGKGKGKRSGSPGPGR